MMYKIIYSIILIVKLLSVFYIKPIKIILSKRLDISNIKSEVHILTITSSYNILIPFLVLFIKM